MGTVRGQQEDSAGLEIPMEMLTDERKHCFVLQPTYSKKLLQTKIFL